MPLATLKEVLDDAFRNGYAVGQFNINNLEFTQAIMEAAEEERSPVILGTSEGAIKYMGIDYTAAIALTAARNATVPVVLHLDHGSSYEWVLKCLRRGWSSIMIDGSHHPLEENIRLTKQVVDACKVLGVSVEGELGRIGGTEDELTVDEREASLVRPEEAKRLVEETGIDALAPAIGSAHGRYKGKPQLDFDRLAAVRDLCKLPLVLHGGSGIPDEDIRKAISLGVAKINVNTENQEAFTAKVREIFAADREVYDPRKYLGPARQAIKDTVKAKIRLFGSNGKA
ncbi:fructose-1,6-bisphosphate aldolase, class II [Kyrpidia spormannii]|uniref:Fructose-1,6-bisphosphate aldolase n=2 Tax=Kyrpidia spormannii TaxID=2055160 RepID=A0A2K8NAB0_9BACL|nr:MULTISPECIES: class II fructose-1,6-bisphosphate aldolase [Kyrpidia]HHY66948.1 class II fructose-1,6-bisphosphate aldolase [Alicyclobacillus sp.]ATY86276.1 fructose-1,6-bisphosphate aldolase, class II [Kyrpidia spormannii]MCL6576587.1 class II fructose-1,6-bisphosphate aldolase [Kyrpidia sp.]CAB3395759.1 fructose-1,6-bisphosphate aldolase [Kyrpidia spormannii]CAB3396306.1 fructose-1,6-bisphosphate aldolase [Kyrpidia spormannii]